MTTQRVRAGSWYAYNPVMMDVINPPFGKPSVGDIVKVVNKYGCPKANTMGMCYIENGFGEFMGMVCTNSLTPVGKKNGHWFVK
jgi:hypothetical protein